jgi:hypothetical protein
MKYINKYLVIGIISTTLLSSCATLSVLERNSQHGGQLTSHFGHGPGEEELFLRCTAECNFHGKKCINLTQRYHGMIFKFGEGGEYDIWNYECTEKDNESQNLNINKNHD